VPDDRDDLVMHRDALGCGEVLVLVARLHGHCLGHHGVAERLLVFGREPQVVHALGRVARVDKVHAEALLDGVRDTEARARVGSHVDARDAERARVPG
jgi:hypothetical protein